MDGWKDGWVGDLMKERRKKGRKAGRKEGRKEGMKELVNRYNLRVYTERQPGQSSTYQIKTQKIKIVSYI